jgi:hypothetical protein
MFSIRKKKPTWRIGWIDSNADVRWECSCGAHGRWRARSTTETKLHRLWRLHVRTGHGINIKVG